MISNFPDFPHRPVPLSYSLSKFMELNEKLQTTVDIRYMNVHISSLPKPQLVI
jgi:hypothetical protein